MNIKLPRKFKKQIINFAKEYDNLAQEREIKIKAKADIRVKIAWVSDDEYDAYDWVIEDESCKKIMEIVNSKIKKFIKKTDDFGKKHYKNKLWLWENVFWHYRPEKGQSYKSLKITWTKLGLET